MKKKVIIIGGGYGGVRAARALAKHKELEILLLDSKPYHYLQTDVYDFIANKTTITDISVSLVTLFYDGSVNFLQRKVTKIIPSENKVVTSIGEELDYDYLITANGSRTFFPSFIEGLSTYAHGVKSIKRSFEFKQKFEEAIYKKVESEGLCEISPDFNIVIGGGGLSGVEIAAAMAEYSERFFKIGGYACGGISIYLVEAAPTILSGLDKFLIEKSKKRLEELGVTIITGDKILKVEEHSVLLGSGKIIPMNFMIWTGGIEVRRIEADGFSYNQRGQLKIDEQCRVVGFENVFAIGDCAEVVNTSGKMLAPTAMVAEFSADIAVHNVLASIEGRELKKVEFDLPGILVALGGFYTIGIIYKIKISGIVGYLAKRAVSDMYKWPLTLKCKQSLLKSCK